VKPRLPGASAGNEQLTAAVALVLLVLLVLLAVEGATLLRLGSLLTVHAFVGMLLTLATTTLPAADRLQDHMSAHVGLDAR
jgi:hypothetical protein